MALLNNADAIYFGDRPVDRIYLGARQVWPWTPALLFQNGEQGGAWDFTSAQGLFQDAAGTVPVTDPGDPIGMATDLSGNGNHMLQATVPARPLWEDGAHFDGVDDLMAAAINLPVEPEQEATLAISGAYEAIAVASPLSRLTVRSGSTRYLLALRGRYQEQANYAIAERRQSSDFDPAVPGAQTATGSFPPQETHSTVGWAEGTEVYVLLNDGPVVSVPYDGEFTAAPMTSVIMGTEAQSAAQVERTERRALFIDRALTAPERNAVRAWLMEGVE